MGVFCFNISNHAYFGSCLVNILGFFRTYAYVSMDSIKQELSTRYHWKRRCCLIKLERVDGWLPKGVNKT